MAENGHKKKKIKYGHQTLGKIVVKLYLEIKIQTMVRNVLIENK